MELLLYRWSTGVQVASAILIAAFFLFLTRTVPRAEARPWAWGWVANLCALAVTVTFWILRPGEPWASVVAGTYFTSKTIFAGFLVLGAWAFAHPGADPMRRVRWVVVPAVVWGAVGALVIDGIDVTGTAQSTVIAGVMALGAYILIRNRVEGAAVLLAGFVVRSLLAAVEAGGYLTAAVGEDVPEWLGLFLAGHSSLDTGAEWMIALGCVLVLYRTVQAELEMSNRELIQTQAQLQGLVDRDALTGLSNRRALPGVFRSVYRTGATILFFDLDGFKEINDGHGHQVGDRYLQTFAGALRAAFRPADHVVRFGGDEFVVVAPDALPEQVLGRVGTLRERAVTPDERVSIGFSVGHSYLPPAGDPDAALKAADQDMYQAKENRRAGSPVAEGT